MAQHPAVLVFSFLTKQRRPPEEIPPDLGFIRMDGMPVIESSALNSLRNAISKGEDPMRAIRELEIPFQYNKAYLDGILEIGSDDYLEYTIPIILANCFGFILGESVDVSEESMYDVLRALLSLNTTEAAKGVPWLYLVVVRHVLECVEKLVSREKIEFVCANISEFGTETLALVVMFLRKVSFWDGLVPVLNLVKLVIEYLLEKHVEFDDTDLMDALKPIVIEQMHPEALDSIISLVKETSSPNISAIYKELPKVMNTLFGGSDGHSMSFCKPEEDYVYSNFKLEDDEYPDSELIDLSGGWVVPAPEKGETTGTFLRTDVKKRIQDVMVLFHDINLVHLDTFYNGCAEVVTTDIEYATFMYHVNHTIFPAEHQLSRNVFEALLYKKVFEPSVISFLSGSKPGFRITSFYRDRVVAVIILHCVELVPDLLEKFVDSPFLFTDIVARLKRQLGVIFPRSLITQRSLDAILSVDLRLAHIYETFEGDKEIVQTARGTICNFFFDLFNNRVADDMRLDMFVRAFQNESFQALILKRLEDAVSASAFLDNSFSIMKFVGVPDDVFDLLFEKVSVTMRTSEERMLHVLTSVLVFLEMQPNEDRFARVMNELVYLVIHVDYLSLKRSIIPKLYSLLMKSTNSYETLLLQLMAQSEVGSDDDFIIKDLKVLPLAVAIASTRGQMDRVFEKMLLLCAFSIANIVRLFDGEIDILIMDMVAFFPADFDFRGIRIINYKSKEDLFGLPMKLLIKIAANVSSPVVAERIVKLLWPGNSEVVDEFLAVLRPLSRFVPPPDDQVLAHPLGMQQHLFHVDKLAVRSLLRRGFTVSVSLFLDAHLVKTMNVASTIFALSGRSASLEVILRGTKICLVVRNSALMADGTGRLDTDSIDLGLFQDKEMSTWTTLTVSMKVSSKRMIKVMTFVGQNRRNPIPEQKFSFSKGDNMVGKFVAGNSRQNSGTLLELSSVYQMRQIAFFGRVLTYDDKRALGGSRKPTQEPYFMWPALPGWTPRLDITLVDVTQKSLSTSPNLREMFQSFYPIDKYMMIMTEFDSCSEEHSLLLLQSLPGLYGASIRDAFGMLPGFLLKTTRRLTENHHLVLVMYLDECTDDADKLILCRDVLFNMAIWIRCEWESLSVILEHMLTDCFDACAPFIKSPDFFSHMIGCLTMIADSDSGFEKHPSIDIEECLRGLDHIVIKKCRDFLTTNDLDVLLRLRPAEVIGSAEEETIEGLSDSGVSSYERTGFTDIVLVLNMMACSTYEKVVAVYSRFRVGVSVLDIFDDLREHPLLYPFCVMATLHDTNEKQLELMAIMCEFAEDEKYRAMILKKKRAWILWPLVLALQGSEEVQIAAGRFIGSMITYEFNTQTFSRVITVMNILAATTTLNVVSVWFHILTCIAELWKRCEDSVTEELMKNCFLFLCVQANCPPFRHLVTDMFIESPFCCEFGRTAPKVTSLSSLSLIRKAFQYETASFYVAIDDIMERCKSSMASIYDSMRTRNASVKMVSEWLSYDREVKGEALPLFRTLNASTPKIHKRLVKLQAEAMAFKSFMNTVLTPHDEPRERSDPLTGFRELIERITESAEAKWKSVYKDAAYKMKVRQYRRDFTFSNGFNSVLLQPYIPDDNTGNRDAAAVLRKPLHAGHGIMWNCQYVTIDHSCAAILSLKRKERDHCIITFARRELKVMMNDIRCILTRNRLQKPTALEFFLINGRSILLDFAPTLSDDIISHFSRVKKVENSDFADYIQKKGLVEKWSSGKISNFAFLMKLNMFSGRSFKDTRNSLIFPFVYLMKQRNFALPSPAQSKDRVAHFLRVLENNTYCFGNAPNNPMLLSYYFPRIEPYTSLHKAIHDGHFDTQARMFTSWNGFMRSLVTGEECKEATPEFFCFPEMFLDLNATEIDSNGTLIGDLDVNGSIFEFVYQNRKRLESPETSRNLNSWIDLIWGVCQKGGGPERINSFIPYLYDDVWRNDDCAKEAVNAILENLGSFPPQIFYSRIPRRELPPTTKVMKRPVRIKVVKVKSMWQAFILEKGNVRLILCFDDGTIQRYTVWLEKGRKEVESVYVAPLKLNLPRNSPSVVSDYGIYVVDMLADRVYWIGFEQQKTFQVDISVKYAFRGMNPGQLITITRTGTVYLTTFGTSVRRLFSVSEETIVSAAFNWHYGQLICATADKYIRFYSCRKMREMREVAIDFIPHKLMTTDGLGLVIAYASKQLLLFSINGAFIKRAPIQCDIYEWAQWQDSAGFDFICLTDSVGNIYVFEAFYPETIRHIGSLGDRIISIAYSHTSRAVVAIGYKMYVHIVPI